MFVFAYIDPGGGSLLIQGLIATLIAVPFVLRRSIRRGISMLRRKGRSRDEGGPPE
jgi:hypothetical protein